MFEEYTEDFFIDQAKAMGQGLGVDVRDGSIYMDAAVGHCIRAAKFFNDLRTVFDMLAVDTCTGDILTEKASQEGIERIPATPAVYAVTITGTAPEVGARMFVQGQYFTLTKISNDYYITAETLGTSVNYLSAGENVMPVYDVEGMLSCILGSLYIPGANEESDESLRARWKEQMAGPSHNGNASHYKTWCESIAGVGRSHILPLYGGENTVVAVIYATDGGVPATSILESVQEYVDPIEEGFPVEVGGETLTFGDGLGNGVGNLGAHFLALAPEETDVYIAFSADIRSGYTVAQAQTEILGKVKNYVSGLVTEGDDHIVLRVSAIGNIISAADSILDYAPSSLTLNGTSGNIDIGDMGTPNIKGVTISA